MNAAPQDDAQVDIAGARWRERHGGLAWWELRDLLVEVPGLAPTDRIVVFFSLLRYEHSRSGLVTAAVGTLARAAGLSERTVRASLRRLEARCFLEAVERGGGCHHTSAYRVRWADLILAGQSATENPANVAAFRNPANGAPLDPSQNPSTNPSGNPSAYRSGDRNPAKNVANPAKNVANPANPAADQVVHQVEDHGLETKTSAASAAAAVCPVRNPTIADVCAGIVAVDGLSESDKVVASRIADEFAKGANPATIEKKLRRFAERVGIPRQTFPTFVWLIVADRNRELEATL
ncbi:MAG: hypothetical protein EPN53_01045 [Acidobacteria bacterium]|nr:MAG: hypothetical protein EPN53_01045 [Acidobacteriota bacterium]